MASPVNASIGEHFQTLEDPRLERPTQPPLLDILGTALCPLLTGGAGVQDRERFGTSKQAWPQTFLTLPPGMPSHATFGRGVARPQAPAFSGMLAVLAPGRRPAHPRRPPLVRWDNRQSVL
jgi:DDE_Tnp_1-associated